MSNPKHTDLSIILTKKLSKSDKKNDGIYFTSKDTVSKTLQFLNINNWNKSVLDILEPSCGSLSYIQELVSLRNVTLHIDGVEKNKTIFDYIQNYIDYPHLNLYNDDFINPLTNSVLNLSRKKYDLIVGNPPYFVMKKNDVNKQYFDFFEGRPNIFIIFLIKSLNLLKDDGVLSFVLPESFLNCLYYNKTRKYIYENYEILNIIDCDDDYIDTKQKTIIFIVKKSSNINNSFFNINDKFVLRINNYVVFGNETKIKELEHLYLNSTTLNDMGFDVKVGSVVWNENKDILTDDESKTRLIYSSDIVDKEIILKKYDNKEKKNYINKQGISEPVLVINRGYGVGDYNFEYAMINHPNYLIENHLIVVRCRITPSTREELKNMFNKIMNSFEDKRTKKFIELYFGNNAINTTELSEILPIY